MSHCPAPFLIIEPFNHFGTDPVTLAATGSFNSSVLDTIGYNYKIGLWSEKNEPGIGASSKTFDPYHMSHMICDEGLTGVEKSQVLMTKEIYEL